MSQVDKLYDRLMSKPSDFTYDEAKKLLSAYGFKEHNKGKTSGSRVAFIRDTDKKTLYLHRPHPQNTLKRYIIDELIELIKEIEEE